MPTHWSIHQLTEYFSVVSATEDEADAARTAVEAAAETLDAECVAAVRDGEVLNAVGFMGASDPGTLTATAEEKVEIQGVGLAHLYVTRASERVPESFVAARVAEAFSGEERQLLQGMAHVLSLSLKALRTVSNERQLRANLERQAEERLQLLADVQAREVLLKELLRIQRAVSRRVPLDQIVLAVTKGISSILGDATSATLRAREETFAPSSIVVVPDSTSAQMRRALRGAAQRAMDDETTVQEVLPTGDVVIASPVGVGSDTNYAVATVATGESLQKITEVLVAFGQQLSTAVMDAETQAQVVEASHDDLTGIPSRAMFLREVSQALSLQPRPELALLFIDLDRFKEVNDSLGHAAGDDLLVAVSERLRKSLRGDDLRARLGGDEFAVLLHGLSANVSNRVAERIGDAIRQPFIVADQEVFIDASIGIVIPEEGETDAAALLSKADIAMYRSKKSDDRPVVVFKQEMHHEARQRLDLRGDLSRAIISGQLDVAYQPLIRLTDTYPTGAEALLRWAHPERGVVSPAQFIPLAEESGLIVKMGEWILQRSLQDLATWRKTFPDLHMNINVSARELSDPFYPQRVLRIIRLSGVTPDAVTLELTETALMRDPEDALTRLEALRDVGVRLAIDDFGTGYSSLAYLRRLPVDELKVDRDFIKRVALDVGDRSVLGFIADLAEELGLRTVAEGIEDEDQLEILRTLGFSAGQGYHLQRPGDRDSITAFFTDSLGTTAGQTPAFSDAHAPVKPR